MRHLLALFPVDRTDLDRHAATIKSRFADPDDFWTAIIITACCIALAFCVAAVFIVAGEAL